MKKKGIEDNREEIRESYENTLIKVSILTVLTVA